MEEDGISDRHLTSKSSSEQYSAILEKAGALDVNQLISDYLLKKDNDLPKSSIPTAS